LPFLDASLAWAGDRMAGRVSVTAYAPKDAAVRFYERVGLGPRRPRSVTLEKPL
jgi:hypothetical protein